MAPLRLPQEAQRSDGARNNPVAWRLSRRPAISLGTAARMFTALTVAAVVTARGPDWRALPFEITSLIFGHFPRRTRLSVLSLVCSRWRRAVLSIPVRWYKVEVSSLMLSVLSINEIEVRTRFSLTPPTSLRVCMTCLSAHALSR